MNKNTTHGMSGTKFYVAWTNMRQRCTNDNKWDYKYYGGRGIKCLWKTFEEFKSDMFKKYKEGLELDRINNDGNYCKENCRWATRKQQLRNYSKNQIIEFKGIKKPLIEWAESTGIKHRTINDRIKRYGWTIEEALTIKTQKKWNPHIKHNKQKYAQG